MTASFSKSRLTRTALCLCLITAVALGIGCSSKKSQPTAPVPDDPTPPVVEFVTFFNPTSQSLMFTPTSEDLVLESLSMGFQHSGLGGMSVATDFAGGLVRRGESKVAHVTTAWTWESTDYYTIGMRVHRPGQTRTFGLCCLGCPHGGGTLQNGPCSR